MTGNRNKATRFAASLGQGFSYLFIGVGILLVLQGDVVGGIWLALVGFILGSSARGAVVQTEFASRIEGITVADVMDAEPVAIPEDASVERALDEYFLRYRWPWFPVVDAAQRFRGLIQRGAADAVPEGSRAASRGRRGPRGGLRPARCGCATTARSRRCSATRRCGASAALAAVDAEGRLRGVITADQVGRALRDALGGAGVSRPPIRGDFSRRLSRAPL